MQVRAVDVADYILWKKGALSAIKLQRLVYYTQAWHLVWKEEPLFVEPIQAWANGPMVPSLYTKHQGTFKVELGLFEGSRNVIAEDSCDVINRILDFYGDKDPQWLSDLTRMEQPWRDARVGIPDGERGDKEISYTSIMNYYSGL